MNFKIFIFGKICFYFLFLWTLKIFLYFYVENWILRVSCIWVICLQNCFEYFYLCIILEFHIINSLNSENFCRKMLLNSWNVKTYIQYPILHIYLKKNINTYIHFAIKSNLLYSIICNHYKMLSLRACH